MSRVTKWKFEKTKVKVVFRLQFHATHIPQTGWNNLFISFIPSDSGKATAKTNKGTVRNGTCKWADPIYETTRLLQDAKTKQYEEKIYKLVVAMGTSRSSILGEASINLSDYVDALKPTVAALPLHGSDAGAILNVTVQLLTSKTGFREFEQQREVSDRGLQTNTDNNSGKSSTPGEAVVSRAEKVSPRVRFKPEPKELPSLEEESGFSEEYADSAAGFDGSSNTSESLYAEKHDNSSTREVDSVKSTISGDLGGVSPTQSPPTGKGPSDHHRFLVQGTSDWVNHLGAETPLDSEIAIVYEDNIRLRGALEAADLSINELRQEITSLQSHADGIAVETQKLTEQLAVEISSEQKLEREISLLKSECIRFKTDIERLKNMKMNPPVPKADEVMSDTGLGVELCHPEGVLLPGLSSVDPTNAMQGEIFKILRELDESKAERESLVTKMGQMECYYEALIQELEENQKQILGELQNLRNEHSTCIYTVSSTKAQMEAMHQQMSEQLLQLAEERCNLDALNKELERRAVSSEAALRRARLNYSIAVKQLQKDLEVLSSQVVSMYETNDNLIQKAFEASQPLQLQGCQEAEDSNIGKVMVPHNQLLGGDRLLEDLRRSLTLQEELYQKIQEELSEMHLANVHLDVFSVMLHQALLEAASDCCLAKEQMNEFAKSNESLKLKLQNIMSDMCIVSEEKAVSVSRCNDLSFQNHTLQTNLTTLLDEKQIMSERISELESLVNDCRSYKSKYEDCDAEKSKFEDLFEQAVAEKVHLSDEMSLLQKELRTVQQEREGLLNERDVSQLSLASAKSEVEIVRQKFRCDMVSKLNASTAIVEKLQTDLEVVGGKLKVSSEADKEYTRKTEDLLADFAKMEVALQELTSKSRDLAEEITALGSVTDELEQNKLTIDKITQENLNLVANLQTKIDESETLTVELNNLRGTVGSLQNELSLERGIRERLEAEVQGHTSKNMGLAEEIAALESVSNELERHKLTIDNITQENQNLVTLLQKKTDEHETLKVELNVLRGTVGSLEAEVLNLNTPLKEREEMIPHFDQQKAELTQLKHQLCHLEANLKKALEDSSDLEIQLLDMHGLLLAADVTNTVIVKHYKCHAENLLQHLECSNQHLQGENSRLLSTLECLRSESESSFSSSRALEHSKSAIASELEECKKRSDHLERKYLEAETQHRCEIDELNCLLECCQKEIDDVILSKEELEIRFLVLKGKVDETDVQTNLVEEYSQELKRLQNQCSELTRKLSEQVLKTEEFKNLSIHLKELKDKAAVQEKKEAEASSSSVAMQESLRIAFIKEQYETKLQELRHQLSVSKKHGEEMLWKLQDSVEELENRRRCEASLLKRIEELEAELQSVLSDNRENFMAYEQVKAELECSIMSLDCCKEEKQQLMASLEERNNEKSKLAEDVEMVREQLENLKAFMRSPEKKEDESVVKKSLPITSCSGREASEEQAEGSLNTENEGVMNQKPLQGSLTTNGEQEISDLSSGQKDFHLNDQLEAQKLLSSMDRLHKELERMKSENTIRSEDENPSEPDNGESLLEMEQAHLEKVSEELGSMSSFYNDSSRSGNSIERVLALELELAEALQAKKKSSIQFQSSFLKLHSDEAAVYQSFRDINELIKDMLEMKGRYGAIEGELREMHERYSQLSLQFAEVEGERQKLMMTLKNVRSPKRLLNQSPSSSLEESS